MLEQNCDFLIIGGGIIGVTLALKLNQEFPDADIIIIEKEARPGLHASGRNSGVLHAGFYYTADSLKARFTREGNRELRNYCQRRGLALNTCGKLVVARDEEEDRVLDILLERGQNNGVVLDLLPVKGARKIEPRIKTWKRALFSPSTTVVDPSEVLTALVQDAIKRGVQIYFGERFVRYDGNNVTSTTKSYRVGYTVNAAGLFADRVAHCFGFGLNYHLLPFKGIYLYGNMGAVSLKTNIYPVPDLRNPFLGVHYTLTAKGQVKIGPTAIPAFWPEQYSLTENFRLDDFILTASRFARLMVKNDPAFRILAFEELKKYSRPYLVAQAQQLLKGVKNDQFRQWGQPGIRAQLINKTNQKLEMDFIVEGDHQSMHILNAVSPAFTCSLPFARYVVSEIKKKIS